MNTNHTTPPPIAWTIAGSDSGGGAGIQADLLTFNRSGVHGCSVITALTAQNTQGVIAIQITSIDQLNAQLQALHDDLPPSAIKLGMLGSLDTLKALSPWLKRYQNTIPIVCDPVMVSTSGSRLMPEEALDYFTDSILPLVDLITPNLLEAQVLVNKTIDSLEAMQAAAYKISDCFKVNNVLIKGGHKAYSNQCRDFFYSSQVSSHYPQGFWLSSQYHDHGNTHGSGCSLSAAITAYLALGYPIQDAVTLAKAYINQGIRSAYQIGQGPGPVAHTASPENHVEEDIPMAFPVGQEAITGLAAFPSCQNITHTDINQPLGLYPLVDSSQQLLQLIPLGITTAQLRIKHQTKQFLSDEIKQCVALAKQYNIRLFINDDWQLAIAHQAYGVHLGQENLDTADLKAIQAAGLRLGISTHSPYEIARAYTIKPSYIAFGPIYPTKSKVMTIPPQGIDRLRYWRQRLSPCPLVAIGGINPDNVSDVLAAQPDGIATCFKSLKSMTELIKQYRCSTQQKPIKNRQQRYSRHIQLPAIGKTGQYQLKQSRVLVIGAGGLGSSALIYLSSMGIGQLGIIDDDTVSLSNLQRQILFEEKDIGQLKVNAAKARLQALNADCDIVTYPTRLTLDNADTLIKAYDVVVDGSDNLRTRYIANDSCFYHKIPYISAGATAFEGQCSVFIAGKTPCYRCVFPVSVDNITQQTNHNCETIGVLATLPGLMGILQATEVIRYLIGLGRGLSNQLLKVDMLTLQFNTFNLLSRDPECVLCGHTGFRLPRNKLTYPEDIAMTNTINTITHQALQEQLKANPSLQLIDVRTLQEHNTYNIGGECIPLDTLESQLGKLKPNVLVVVYCQAGIRSAKAAALLQEQGFTDVSSLQGGVNAIVSEDN